MSPPQYLQRFWASHLYMVKKFSNVIKFATFVFI
jgi:hypothetical protein